MIQTSIYLDYELFSITFCSSSTGNLHIILANNDIVKNIEEDYLIFKINSEDFPCGHNNKLRLIHSENFQDKEKSSKYIKIN